MRNLLVAFLMLTLPVLAQNELMRFRIYLTDKHGVAVNTHTVFLSPEALNRRARQGISLDSTDLPVYRGYIDTLKSKGLHIISSSRWMNTVVVSVTDSSKMDVVEHLPFVKSSRMVWMNPYNPKKASKRKQVRQQKFQIDSVGFYGRAETQVEMLGLDGLHAAGFKGKGITIAVLDAGFSAVDTLNWFKKMDVKASRDFVYPPLDIFRGHSHGTSVLSLMASNNPFQFMGTAPEASYCLLRTEDVLSEFPVEEDYWVAAAEYADSIGADVVNSSLGYTEFELPKLSYKQADLDGKTAFISQAATLAASKGMLVVVSAGNDGERTWRKIGFPADSPEVLSVGSVQSDLSRSTFSSIGPAADGRIKPDLMTLGHYVSYVSTDGQVTNGYGTSFSAPMLSGMAACLWQALPALSASKLRTLLRESGDRFANPDTLYGYGIPNAQRAWLSVQNQIEKTRLNDFYCYFSPLTNRLHIAGFLKLQKHVCVLVYDLFGRKLLERNMEGNSLTLDVQTFPNSIYLINFVVNGNERFSQKIAIRR